MTTAMTTRVRDILAGAKRRGPSLSGATTWLGPPLTERGLDGHVVAYDFWTYTCVNWLRTLPYLRAWHERYRTHGLTVVGIHTPEFPFEQDIDNVRVAIVADRIDYAVVIDNDYDIWRAFGNRYWPALYLAGADGVIRHHHFGEGGYEESENAIRQLLQEAGAGPLPSATAELDVADSELAADWPGVHSPETYLGAAYGGRPATEPLRQNQWTLNGMWTVGPGSVSLTDSSGSIAFRFRARDVNLVMAPTRGDVPFRVSVDGGPPGASCGVDCDVHGAGVLSQPRMYQLIRQRDRTDDRVFEIAFDAPGVEGYVFTFG